MMKKNKFTEISMRTWNWLGVNSAPLSSSVEVATQQINVSAGESRKITDINLGTDPTARKIHVKVDHGGEVEIACIDLGQSDSYIEIIIDLDGDNSKARLASAYFGDGNRKVDLNYIIRQRGKKTEANMEVRGALSDNCDKIFRGTLDFQEGSSGSIGREKEEVIVLSDSVRNRSVPLMLSHEDDVDGHHAVTVGKIDENKLFYLMSRGLDRIEAQKLIVEAAFTPVLERFDDEDLRSKIFETIQRRLSYVE